MATYGRYSEWTGYHAEVTQIEAVFGHSLYRVEASRFDENRRRRDMQPEPLDEIPARFGKFGLLSNKCMRAGCNERFDGSADVGVRGGFSVHSKLHIGGRWTGGQPVIPTEAELADLTRDLPAHHDNQREERKRRIEAPVRAGAAANPRAGGAPGAAAPAAAAAAFPAVNTLLLRQSPAETLNQTPQRIIQLLTVLQPLRLA